MRRQTQKGTTRNKSVCSLKRSTSGDDDDEEEEEEGGGDSRTTGRDRRPALLVVPKTKKGTKTSEMEIQS